MLKIVTTIFLMAITVFGLSYNGRLEYTDMSIYGDVQIDISDFYVQYRIAEIAPELWYYSYIFSDVVSMDYVIMGTEWNSGFTYYPTAQLYGNMYTENIINFITDKAPTEGHFYIGLADAGLYNNESNFILTPIPEPLTAILIVWGMFIINKRRRYG